MKRNNRAKILFIDIETAPAKVYTFQLRDVTIGIEQIIQDSYMLCWSAKWFHSSKMLFDSIINYPGAFKKDPTNELNIAKTIWKLLDEADIVVAHNGNSFDVKWINSVFLKYGLPPPSSYQTIDTVRASRRHFYQISHRLAFLTHKHAIGDKMKHEGFSLWPKCMSGDKQAWKTMLKYNKNDVVILEKWYVKIRPYISNHPKLSLYTNNGKVMSCESCESKKFKKKGFLYTRCNKYQRYICLDCGRNTKDPKPIKESK